jgi:drug/metabolite transporter (DMT)-like permease
MQQQSNTRKPWSQTKADFMVALIATTWGSAYIMMKFGLDTIPPFSLIALRFGIAFICIAILFAKELKQTTPRIIKKSAILGTLLFGVFAFLLHGMETTTASNAGFLISTTVVFVPLFHAILSHTIPDKKTTIGVVITIIGIALLSLQESLGFHMGDILCFAAALTYTAFILLTDVYSKDDDPLLLGIWQLGFTAALAIICTFIFETPTLPSNGAEWAAILGLALICSAFCFVVQPIAQAYTTPEHTALLFSLEPVSTAAFAYVFLHEVLNTQGMIGAVLVLCGVLFASVQRAK